jgi:hypothetical protein
MNRNLKENCLPWSSLGGQWHELPGYIDPSFLLIFVSLETL